MLWLALHLPALSLEAWCATLAPEKAGRPLALLHDHQVVLPDARARALGVRPGMKRATAQALAPELLLGQADARRDADALRAVAHVALAFSPAVAWATPALWRPTPAQSTEQGCPPQPAPSPALVGVRLEVQSCLRYFGGLPRLLDRLRAQLAPLGHRVRIASAPTALGAALLAAGRADLALGPHSRSGPSGLQALQPLLDGVPLHWLGLDAVRQQALQAMGLATLADVAGLPRDGLARRLGPELLQRIDRARGHLPEAHSWLTLPQAFDSRLELMARADTSAQVLAGARILLARLVAWATARQARIARFTLGMHHEPRHRADHPVPERTPLEIAPAQASADAAHLHSLLTEHLERLPLPAPALELSLHCSALVAGAAPNGELFASRRSQQEGLGRLVERLQARLGPGQVQQLAAVADHRPEHGTRWQPAAAGALAADSAMAWAPAAHLPPAPAALPPQPIWLLPQPQPLAERQQRPLLAGQPLQLLAGPERLETGWWDNQLALRDYFIAQAAGGALVWVFRTRAPVGEADAGWFLQGLFG
jgi:protein ImuB